jgi:heme exporter protein B
VLFFHEIFFGVEILKILPELLVIILLTSSAFCAIGTLLSAISVSIRNRELILPLILFPVIIPLLAGAVDLTHQAIGGQSIDFGGFWFLFLVCSNTISLTLCSLMIEYVVRD